MRFFTKGNENDAEVFAIVFCGLQRCNKEAFCECDCVRPLIPHGLCWDHKENGTDCQYLQ
jgi:hypothetical protein